MPEKPLKDSAPGMERVDAPGWNDLMGRDLPNPVRVVRIDGHGPRGIGSGKTGLARNIGPVRSNQDTRHLLVRVKLDGAKHWETWHRSYWRLAEGFSDIPNP